MDDRLPPVSCHSVEVAVGCQDIIQSSIGIQCSMEDEVSQCCVHYLFVQLSISMAFNMHYDCMHLYGSYKQSVYG